MKKNRLYLVTVALGAGDHSTDHSEVFPDGTLGIPSPHTGSRLRDGSGGEAVVKEVSVLALYKHHAVSLLLLITAQRGGS